MQKKEERKRISISSFERSLLAALLPCAGVCWLIAHEERSATWASPTHPLSSTTTTHTNTHFPVKHPELLSSSFLETAADRTCRSQPPTLPFVSFMFTPSSFLPYPPSPLSHLTPTSSNHFHLSYPSTSTTSSSSPYNFTSSSSQNLFTSRPPSFFCSPTLSVHLPLSHLPRTYQKSSPPRFFEIQSQPSVFDKIRCVISTETCTDSLCTVCPRLKLFSYFVSDRKKKNAKTALKIYIFL